MNEVFKLISVSSVEVLPVERQQGSRGVAGERVERRTLCY